MEAGGHHVQRRDPPHPGGPDPAACAAGLVLRKLRQRGGGSPPHRLLDPRGPPGLRAQAAAGLRVRCGDLDAGASPGRQGRPPGRAPGGPAVHGRQGGARQRGGPRPRRARDAAPALRGHAAHQRPAAEEGPR